jgi:hypothetical protein
VFTGEIAGDTKPAVTPIVVSSKKHELEKAEAATGSVAARMDVESTEDSGSLFQIVQMKLVRRARYCAPIAEGKSEAAEVGTHLEIYDISFAGHHAT